MSSLSYPIGPFQAVSNPTLEDHARWIADIAAAPGHLADAVQGLTPAQLDTPYREGGWTVRQVVHHVPDSHMQSYARFRLALTEDRPSIKPYAEALWAELPDARTAPPELSLALLAALHSRWVILLHSLSASEWGRAYRHPELGDVTLTGALQLYSWHGRHHAAHITGLRSRMGWA